jgi:hypothetical protein
MELRDGLRQCALTLTALPITSAGRFLPLGPVGTINISAQKRESGYVSPARKQPLLSANRLRHEGRNPALRDQGESSIQRPFCAQPNRRPLQAHIRSSMCWRVGVEISAPSGYEHSRESRLREHASSPSIRDLPRRITAAVPRAFDRVPSILRRPQTYPQSILPMLENRALLPMTSLRQSRE